MISGETVLDFSEKPVLVLCLFGIPTCFFVVNLLELVSHCSQKKNSGSGSSVADERVDYVVVDQQKTLALKSTREAWTDGRQSTESETPRKVWSENTSLSLKNGKKWILKNHRTTMAVLFSCTVPDSLGWESVPHWIGWKPKRHWMYQRNF